MDPMFPYSSSSQNSSSSQTPFRFPSFMSMLGNSNMPYNYQSQFGSTPQPEANPPRFFSPPYCPIPPNFYPNTFQSFGVQPYPPTQNTPMMDTPQYCTQVDGEEEEDDVQVIAPVKEVKKMWSTTEDELLISAWLNTSKDAIVGTDQRGTAFWKRIEQYYMENKAENGVPRSSTQCKHRWQKISQAVSKFVGCYEEASQQKRSGQSSSDVYAMAKKIYSNDGASRDFTCEHAWHLLKVEPKWMLSYVETHQGGGGSSKRTKINEVGEYTSSSNPSTPYSGGDEGIPLVRPIGVKATKKKGKQVRKKSLDSSGNEEVKNRNAEAIARIDRIAEAREGRMKQKDYHMQERVRIEELKFRRSKNEMLTSKYAMLTSLVNKGDNLSIAEQKIKEQLLEEFAEK